MVCKAQSRFLDHGSYGDIYSICSTQVVSLTLNIQWLVPKNAWYSIYQFRLDEILSESTPSQEANPVSAV